MQQTKFHRFGMWIAAWFDNEAASRRLETMPDKRVDWARIMSFAILHGGVLGVLWVGWSWVAVCVALFLYAVRAMCITAFYHRYFSHKSFETSRPAQFAFALLGNSAAQRGPLWWAAHHRYHHSHSDKEGDPHSPHEHSFYWAHMGWITSPKNFRTRYELIPDFARYPEIRFLDRFDWFVPIGLAAMLYGLGALLQAVAPGLGTSGPQMLVWGFFISTVVLFHITCMVNSIAHKVGSRPFRTSDESRNNWLVAILTMGEGWHNNHHFYPNSVRQGFLWWEMDLTWYALILLNRLGLIWNLHGVPGHVLAKRGVA